MRSQIRPWKTLFAIVLLSAAGAVVPGCGGPNGGSFCDAEASCEGWSQAQYNGCLSNADHDVFLSDQFGCGAFLRHGTGTRSTTSLMTISTVTPWLAACGPSHTRWLSTYFARSWMSSG